MVIEPLAHFHGGLVLRHHKQQSCEQALQHGGLPDELIIALRANKGNPSEPVVRIGDRVLKGQVIAQPAHPYGAVFHAPTSGLIKDITEQRHHKTCESMEVTVSAKDTESNKKFGRFEKKQCDNPIGEVLGECRDYPSRSNYGQRCD